MTDSNSKGSRRERQLRNFFREVDGYEPLRMPASGSGTTMDLPDLLVGRHNGSVPLAIELKSGADALLYVTAEEVEALLDFCEAFGAEAVLAGRWDGDSTYYLRHVSNVPTTDSGNYRLKKQDFVTQYDMTVEKPD